MKTPLARIQLPVSDEPLAIAWPSPGSPGTLLSFNELDQWQNFIANLSLNPLVPQVARAKFAKAQKLYLLGWNDRDLIKAGELVALISLELALKDRYGGKIGKRKTFAH